MFNRKPLAVALIIAAALFFSGVLAGVRMTIKSAHCTRIIFDTAYVNTIGGELSLLADTTYSPRQQ